VASLVALVFRGELTSLEPLSQLLGRLAHLLAELLGLELLILLRTGLLILLVGRLLMLLNAGLVILLSARLLPELCGHGLAELLSARLLILLSARLSILLGARLLILLGARLLILLSAGLLILLSAGLVILLSARLWILLSARLLADLLSLAVALLGLWRLLGLLGSVLLAHLILGPVDLLSPGQSARLLGLGLAVHASLRLLGPRLWAALGTGLRDLPGLEVGGLLPARPLGRRDGTLPLALGLLILLCLRLDGLLVSLLVAELPGPGLLARSLLFDSASAGLLVETHSDLSRAKPRRAPLRTRVRPWTGTVKVTDRLFGGNRAVAITGRKMGRASPSSVSIPAVRPLAPPLRGRSRHGRIGPLPGDSVLVTSNVSSPCRR